MEGTIYIHYCHHTTLLLQSNNTLLTMDGHDTSVLDVEAGTWSKYIRRRQIFGPVYVSALSHNRIHLVMLVDIMQALR